MIIGLCGFAQSGKSTTAEHLEKKYGFQRVNMKDGLISEMKQNFPELLKELCVTYNMTIDELFKEKPPAMRALMQNYGTNVRRNDDPNHWVDIWTNKVSEMKGNIVVDDIRFFNELSALTEKDGVLIRVKRPDIVSAGSHKSETEQRLFIEDFTIEGVAGSHTEIYEQADEIINVIKRNYD